MYLCLLQTCLGPLQNHVTSSEEERKQGSYVELCANPIEQDIPPPSPLLLSCLFHEGVWSWSRASVALRTAQTRALWPGKNLTALGLDTDRDQGQTRPGQGSLYDT
ncbi:hypothetical protein WMY93_033727, partial [Mugilogobius chulae]